MKNLSILLLKEMISVVLFLLIYSNATAQKTRSLNGPETGTLFSDTAYTITGNVTVPTGQTLTIQKGTKIVFSNGNNTTSQLMVYGTLIAQGSKTDSINLTGGPFSYASQRGPITFESTSSNSILQYVNISQLGYNSPSDNIAAIYINSSSCTISDCNIQNINGTSVSIANSITPVITNNNFANNVAYLDVVLGLDNVRLLKGNNPLKVGLITSSMAKNDTLTSQNTYYRLLANQIIPVSKTLVINPNVEVQFTNGNNTTSQLDVQGTLKAKGDALNYINFTGGGFSYASQRGPITFENTSSNSILQYVNISQLGYNSPSDNIAAIYINSSSCTISDCNIQNINGTSMSIANSITPTISNNNFANNVAYLDVILGLDNVRLLKGNNPLKVGLITSSMAKNDTLTSQNTYYRLLANQIIPVSKTLVINPNVEVQFTNGNNTTSQLDVQGTLKAIGDASNYVNFTGGALTYGSQRGPITFDSTSSKSALQYVNISQLGYNFNSDITAAIIVSSSSCTISDCNIQSINGTAISISNSTTPIISNNNFTSNTNMDVILGLDNVRLLKGNNPLKVGLVTSSMGLNDTLTADNTCYRLLNKQAVPISKTLVINPNVEVQFTNGNNTTSQLVVQGTLKAIGDASNYVNFTGGALTYGSQRGPITFESTSSKSVLQYVNISQLGYNFNSGSTPILIIKSSSCVIVNTIIQNCNGVAVQVTNSASPSFLQDCFYTNLSGAVLSTSGTPSFRNCNFVGNKSGIVNTSATDNVTATNCWWGDASGPFQRATNSTGVGDSVSNGVKYSPFSTDQFDCSADAGPLPLTLLNFQVSSISKNAICTWQTATEINTKSFVIEHSIDGLNFTQVGIVDASGNSSITISYRFTDMAPGNGINYYRLKMVDKDGKYTYSNIVRINIKSAITLTISPNPASNNISVQILREENEKVIVQVTDMQGRILSQQNKQLQKGISSFSINTSSLSKGLYRLVVRGITIESQAFVKQ